MNDTTKVEIRNVKCNSYELADVRQLFDCLTSVCASGSCKSLMFLNINAFYLAQKSVEYRAILNSADIMLNDGVGIDKLAQSYGVNFKENLNGTDLIPMLLEWTAAVGKGVYLLGASEENVAEAARILDEKYGPDFVRGKHHGFIFESTGKVQETLQGNAQEKSRATSQAKVHVKPEYADKVVDDINNSGAQLLLLGMGMPLQELWMGEMLGRLKTTQLAVAGGAIIDYLSNNVKRSPKIFVKLRLEWLYRLLRNPKRMWKRNVQGVLTLYKYRNKKK